MRPALNSTSTFFRQTSFFVSRISTNRRFSFISAASQAQGYGDDANLDPKGGKPSQQGSSNITKQNAEHPGPAPPAEGVGSGLGPTKGLGNESEDISAQSGGSRSEEAKETGQSPTGGKIGGGGGLVNN